MENTKQNCVKQENAKQENTEQEKPKPKLPRMQVFQTIQKNFAIAGITPDLVNQAYPLNVKILMGFLSLNSGAYFNLAFTLYYADTFAEYTQSIYVFSLVDLIIFALLIVVLQVDKLFKFVNTCCDIVNSSQYWIHIGQAR